jgi:hypothetical protein
MGISCLSKFETTLAYIPRSPNDAPKSMNPWSVALQILGSLKDVNHSANPRSWNNPRVYWQQKQTSKADGCGGANVGEGRRGSVVRSEHTAAREQQ